MTLNQEGAWVEVDFLCGAIIPVAYSFASAHPIYSGYYPRCVVCLAALRLPAGGHDGFGRLQCVLFWKKLMHCQSSERPRKLGVCTAEMDLAGHCNECWGLYLKLSFLELPM